MKVIGDPNRLRQVIINLVGNAVKFTHAGEVFVDVTVGRLSEQRVELHFSVRDTGIGIPADKHEAIFEAFRQADSSTTRRYGERAWGWPFPPSWCNSWKARFGSRANRAAAALSTSRLNSTAATLEASRVRLPSPLSAVASPLVAEDNASQRSVLGEFLADLGMVTTLANAGQLWPTASWSRQRLGV